MPLPFCPVPPSFAAIRCDAVAGHDRAVLPGRPAVDEDAGVAAIGDDVVGDGEAGRLDGADRGVARGGDGVAADAALRAVERDPRAAAPDHRAAGDVDAAAIGEVDDPGHVGVERLAGAVDGQARQLDDLRPLGGEHRAAAGKDQAGRAGNAGQARARRQLHAGHGVAAGGQVDLVVAVGGAVEQALEQAALVGRDVRIEPKLRRIQVAPGDRARPIDGGSGGGSGGRPKGGEKHATVQRDTPRRGLIALRDNSRAAQTVPERDKNARVPATLLLRRRVIDVNDRRRPGDNRLWRQPFLRTLVLRCRTCCS